MTMFWSVRHANTQIQIHIQIRKYNNQCSQLRNPPMNVKGTRTKVHGGLTVLSPTYIYQCTQLRNPPMNVKGIRFEPTCIGAQLY